MRHSPFILSATNSTWFRETSRWVQAQNLRAGRGDQNAIVAQAAGDLPGGSEAGMHFDKDEIGLRRARFEAEPFGLFDRPCQNLGVTMVVG